MIDWLLMGLLVFALVLFHEGGHYSLTRRDGAKLTSFYGNPAVKHFDNYLSVFDILMVRMAGFAFSLPVVFLAIMLFGLGEGLIFALAAVGLASFDFIMFFIMLAMTLIKKKKLSDSFSEVIKGDLRSI